MDHQKRVQGTGIGDSATSVRRGLTALLGLLCCNTQNNEHTDTMTVGATNRTEHEEKGEQIKRRLRVVGREEKTEQQEVHQRRNPGCTLSLCHLKWDSFQFFKSLMIKLLFFIIKRGVQKCIINSIRLTNCHTHFNMYVLAWKERGQGKKEEGQDGFHMRALARRCVWSARWHRGANSSPDLGQALHSKTLTPSQSRGEL